MELRLELTYIPMGIFGPIAVMSWAPGPQRVDVRGMHFLIN